MDVRSGTWRAEKMYISAAQWLQAWQECLFLFRMPEGKSRGRGPFVCSFCEKGKCCRQRSTWCLLASGLSLVSAIAFFMAMLVTLASQHETRYIMVGMFVGSLLAFCLAFYIGNPDGDYINGNMFENTFDASIDDGCRLHVSSGCDGGLHVPLVMQGAFLNAGVGLATASTGTASDTRYMC